MCFEASGTDNSQSISINRIGLFSTLITTRCRAEMTEESMSKK